MKHIEINDQIREWASDFREDLREVVPGYELPLTRLEDLKTYVQNDAQQESYVQEIIDEWENLIVATPDTFADKERAFKKRGGNIDLEKKVTIWVRDKHNQPKAQILPFHEAVVWAMRYDRVQSRMYPKYMRLLGIRSCVYCNAQYAFSVEGDKGYQNYDLDHLLPKSKYPYLCTSFFNLQPSCPTCNRKKGKKDIHKGERRFHLFVQSGTSLDPTSFKIDDESMVNYLMSPDKDAEQLKILFSCEDAALEKMFNRFFHIKTLYQAHKDVAEELIWKQKIYNKAYQEVFRSQFRKLGIKESDFNRFILGNYDMVGNIHKRPLAKMTQDIARQLGIIEKQK